MFMWNPAYFIFIAPALLLMLFAQFKVQGTYRKYSQVANRLGISGLEAAQRLLRANGLNHVQVKGVRGQLTDHYDPRSKELHLSEGVGHSASVAALGIVAHECGHAVQDKTGYFPLRLRAGLVPMVNIGGYMGYIFFLIGLFLQITGLVWLGVIFFSGGVVFALATLPVELNASNRAMQMLESAGLVGGQDELKQAKSVLNAAALTYVAALAMALFQLLYYISIAAGMSGRRRR
ncbi:MAG: zinc metallopeptidase [Anaerolineales bacterium]|nr:zinc metallopeptidase [Anaerolineales bacterium]